ncbi:similar to TRICHOME BIREFRINGENCE-LIKE 34 [Actinidia rufa]|uniref:Similar to TRICHOME BIREFRINGENCE-LIKE 34 n=1 Tax=Actinidia rufa TaxID=165716 RepID=A0A7J0FC26_9ERIC|nr:similar to TRICHOME BIREFRINGENCE-LIKE 34 [Actinidia rufa]
MAKKLQVVSSSWAIRCSFQTLIGLLVAILVIGAIYLTRESEQLLEEQVTNNQSTDGDESVGSSTSCDLFSGKWVFDNKSYPLYKEKDCTFMSDQLACEKFGRKDLSYQHWRFNATALLERLRNKRLVFVGDSLNRNQWVSMVCLVGTSIPPELKSMHGNGSLVAFKAHEYNATIEYYWAPLLVESNSDDPVKHRLPDRIVRAQSIEKHALHWTDADILIFNSYLWWRRPKIKVLANEWGRDAAQNCYNETEPIWKEGHSGSGSSPKMMKVVEGAIEGLKMRGLKVQVLNITQLTEYRKEGHPSIYRKQWEPLTEEQVANPESYADCIHWCLPGVPDVWNELLYASIFGHDKVKEEVEL